MIRIAISVVASAVLLVSAQESASGSTPMRTSRADALLTLDRYLGSGSCTGSGCPSCLDMMGGGGPGHSFQSGGTPTDPGTGTEHVAWRANTCGDDGHTGCEETFDLLSTRVLTSSAALHEDQWYSAG
jgi:hypothetical protein